MSSKYGSLSLHSLGIRIPSYSNRDFIACYSKYCTNNIIDPNKLNWKNVSNFHKNLLLTERHENDHFFQLISSSFGIFTYRIQNILIRDLSWIRQEFNKIYITINLEECSLINWLEKEGLRLLNTNLNPSTNELAIYIEKEFIPGFKFLNDLLELSFAKSPPPKFKDLTIGSFCNLLNDANTYIRQRTDVDIDHSDWTDIGFNWDSKLPRETKIFKFEKDPFLSYGSLLEVLAYLDELRFLIKHGGYDSTDYENWIEDRVPTDFVKHIELFISIFKTPSAARAFLAKYLDSRIDVSSGSTSRTNTIHYVEDEWPQLFYHLVDLKTDINQFIERKLTNSIISYESVLSRKKLFGKKSNWGTSEVIHSEKWNFNEHTERINLYFIQGITRKLEILKSQTNKDFKKIDLNDLIWSMEYKDCFFIKEVNTDTSMQESMQNVISAVIFQQIAYISLMIINGKPVSVPSFMTEKIMNTILPIQLRESVTKKKLNEIENLIAKFFTKKWFNLCFSGIRIKWFKPVKNI